MPSIYVIKDKLITQEDYVLKMKEMARRSIKFSGTKGSMIAKLFLETMWDDFSVQNEAEHIFTVNPTFAKYIEVHEIYHRVTKWQYKMKRDGKN